MTDVPEMVERVARALDEAQPRYEPRHDLVDLRVMARAAIEAMREPTEAMKSADLGNGHTCAGYLDMYSAPTVYRAMIDAALGKLP